MINFYFDFLIAGMIFPVKLKFAISSTIKFPELYTASINILLEKYIKKQTLRPVNEWAVNGQ